MKKITRDEFRNIHESHVKWLESDGREGRRADLSDMDFSGWELPEINLAMADLAGSNFSGANLLIADISQADLFGANLSGADLSGADLLVADLIEANLSGADLSVADISGANLSRANLSAAALTQTDLSGSNLSGADLSGADLTQANLNGADMGQANLTQARLLKANLTGANLSGANLLLAPTYSAQFHGADLTAIIIDSLTLSQLPVDVTRKYRDTFQIINLDRSSEFTTIREVELQPPFFQAGLLLLSYFASVLAQTYSPSDLRIKIELKSQLITLFLEAYTSEIQGKVEESLEICGLVLQGKIIPDALSEDKNHVLRLANQFEVARNLMIRELELTHPQASDHNKVDGDLKWLQKQIGRMLQHSRTRASGMPLSMQAPIIQFTTGPQLFQGVIKELMETRSEIKPELLVIFQKLSLKTLDGIDVIDLENSLKMIRKKSPKVFRKITEAFYDCGMGQGRSVWGNAFVKAAND